MNMNEFQKATLETAVYPDKGERTMAAFNYCVVGLCGEAGELANKWKKVLRADGTRPDYAALVNELGDCLWYIARATDELGFDLNNVVEVLVERLRSRKERDVVKGSGDNR